MVVLGANAIYTRDPLQRFPRDTPAINQHFSFKLRHRRLRLRYRRDGRQVRNPLCELRIRAGFRPRIIFANRTGGPLHRRRVIRVLAAVTALLGAPAALAQQEKVWRIGFLYQRSRESSVDRNLLGAFLRGLSDLGYVEGKNILIEWRFADGKYELFPGMAAELAHMNVDIIVAGNPPAIKAAQHATRTIPVVMISAPDPVDHGFIKSLSHPGGNITGLANLAIDVSVKQIELLRTILPKTSRFAALLNPDNPDSSAAATRIQQAAAMQHRLQAIFVTARSARDLDGAFAAAVSEHVQAIITPADGALLQHRAIIAQLSMKHRLPAFSVFRENVEAGALLSYGPNLSQNYRRAAAYVDKILKGAKPADLPVEQPNTLHMSVNLRTAKALALSIPQEVLLRADEVID